MHPELVPLAIVFFIAFLVSVAIAGIAAAIARRMKLLAQPVKRSSHTIPTPQVGGVGICLTLIAGLIFFPQISNSFFMDSKSSILLLQPSASQIPNIAFLFVVAYGFILGLIDDLRSLSTIKKLLGLLILAAIPLIAQRAFLDAVNPFPDTPIGVAIAFILAFGWILFFVNAYNFMDGVNGQSGFFALNAIAWWIAYWFLLRSPVPMPMSFETPQTLLLLALLAGSVAGFLIWNFPRSVTFMGDCGSLPIGGILALIVLFVGTLGKFPDPFITFAFPLALYIYDVIITLIRRFRRRENLFAAHRSHLYQRLLIATGWSHARLLKVHLPMYFASGAAGLVYSYAMKNSDPATQWAARAMSIGSIAFLLAAYHLFVAQTEKKATQSQKHQQGQSGQSCQ